MKLEIARLCLDCDEIHEDQICPVCSSEAFAFLTRWVKPSAEHRAEARRIPAPVQSSAHPARTPEQIEAYRQLIEGKPDKGPGLVAKSVMGLAAVSLIGWAWRSTAKRNGGGPAPEPGARSPSGESARRTVQR